MHCKRIIAAFAISAFSAAALTACGGSVGGNAATGVEPGAPGTTGSDGSNVRVTAVQAVTPTITQFTVSEGGTAAVAARGGVRPYTFELMETQNSSLTVNGDGTVPVPPAMTPGTYQMRVRVRDAAEQEAVAEFAITVVDLAADPNQLKLEVTGGQNEVTFEGNRGGSVRVVATGGQPDYTWRINFTDFEPTQSAVSWGADAVSGGEATGLITVQKAVRLADEKIEIGKDPKTNEPIYDYFARWEPGACYWSGSRKGSPEHEVIDPSVVPYKMVVAVKDAHGREAVTPMITINVDCSKL